jgi:ATP-binding cassette subfamily B (MDR/TAP) protein 1
MNVIQKYNSKLDAAVARSTRGALVYFLLYALTESLDLLRESYHSKSRQDKFLTATVMAFMFWYGGRLLSLGELRVDEFFIIYTAALFGGQAAGFAFGYFAGMPSLELLECLP